MYKFILWLKLWKNGAYGKQLSDLNKLVFAYGLLRGLAGAENLTGGQKHAATEAARGLDVIIKQKKSHIPKHLWD